MDEYINTPLTYVYRHKFKLTTRTQGTQVGNLKQYRTMKRSEYVNEKMNPKEGARRNEHCDASGSSN